MQSGVWRVLRAKRSRRTCGFTADFYNKPQTQDIRSPLKKLDPKRRPVPRPRLHGFGLQRFVTGHAFTACEKLNF
jgi:hypothetical protein